MSSLDQSSVNNISLNKQKFRDLQVSVDDLSNNSVWMSKKQRSQIEKHIEILKNRLGLLGQEEYKAKKKVLETKKKTNDLFRLKIMNYEEQLSVILLNLTQFFFLRKLN